jgi:hypothetical protein
MMGVMYEVASGAKFAVSMLVEVSAHLSFECGLMEFIKAVCEETVFTVDAKSTLGKAFTEL